MAKKNTKTDITVIIPIHELVGDDNITLFKSALKSVADQETKVDEVLAPPVLRSPWAKRVAQEVEGGDRILQTPIGIFAVDDLGLLRMGGCKMNCVTGYHNGSIDEGGIDDQSQDAKHNGCTVR